MTNKLPLRNQTFDVLKGIALLLMIQVHIMELFASPEILSSRVGQWSLFLGGAPVAPVFLILFGYYLGKRGDDTKYLLFRGLKIFLLAMLLNVALNMNLLYSVQKGVLAVNPWSYVFGADVLHFAGLSLIMFAFVLPVIYKNIVYIMLAIVLVFGITHFLSQLNVENENVNYVFAFVGGPIAWSYYPLFPWLAYPLFGAGLSKLGFDFSSVAKFRWKFVFIPVFAVVMFYTLPYALNSSVDLKHYYHHTFLFFIWVIIFLFFYGYFIHELNKLKSSLFLLSYLRWLGKNVTVVYVIQWIIIGNIATAIYKTVSEISTLFAYYAGIILLVSLFTFVVLKVKSVRGDGIKT